MRHALTGRKFSRDTNERKALMMNLAKSLIEFEQIKTTLPKAKDLRPFVEKLITLGKKNTLHSRRQLIAALGSNELATKVMTTLSERYGQRLGGYTRIIKAGYRHGDNAAMAFIEFIDRDPAAKPKAVPATPEASAE